MNRVLRRFLRAFIQIEIKLETLFGLCHDVNSCRSALYARAVSATFVIAYPITCNYMVNFSKDSAVTVNARNLNFSICWLLVAAIALNSLSHSDYNGLNEIAAPLRDVIDRQTLTENMKFFICIAFRMLFILPRLCYSYYRKYSVNSRRDAWQGFTLILLLPYVLMMLATNRIHIVNSVVKRQLKAVSSSGKSSASIDLIMNLNIRAIKLARLHDIFTRHNNANAVNLLVTIILYMMQIIYEVNVSLSRAAPTCLLSRFNTISLSPHR